MSRQNIFKQIDFERAYQDNLWGGSIHDDKHGTRDWTSFIAVYLGRANGVESNWGEDLDQVRAMFIKVATLAVAAIESIDRNSGDE